MDQTPLKDIPQEKDYPIAHLLRVENLELKDTKKGDKQYLSFTLSDSTASLKWCKKWDADQDVYERYKKSKVLFVTGKTDVYKDNLSVVCDSLALPDDEVDTEFLLDQLLPKSSYDVDFLKKELWGFIKAIENPHIKELCFEFIKDPEVKAKLATSVAAVSVHHPYKAGLITHIVRLIYLATSVADTYNKFMYPDGKYKVNKDILVFLSLVHDLYKIREYDGMEYSDNGNLVPHLPLGAIQANRLMDKLDDFPEELRTQLTHGLLAHHGQVAWGSPVVPCTVEAVIFHFCDNMGAKVDPMLEALDKLPEGEVWTGWLKGIGKKAYMGGMLVE
jgi:3'-5' exoribonuclease